MDCFQVSKALGEIHRAGCMICLYVRQRWVHFIQTGRRKPGGEERMSSEIG